GLEPPSFARRSLVVRSSFAHPATALAAVLTELGSEPGNRTLHVQFVGLPSPPGELLAMLAGRRGVEPRWSDLDTNPIPDRSLWSAGRTRQIETECARLGSNQRSPVRQTGIHPLNCVRVEPPVGIEPTPAAYEAATRPSCCEGNAGADGRVRTCLDFVG